jgi:polyisoprenoid-binding protein YceI
MIRTLLLTSLTLLAAFGQSYDIDTNHSSAGFSVKHMMVSNVSGRFGGVKGSVKLDEKNLAQSYVEATIDVTTVNTADAKRDEHLKSPDFFDVAKFNSMTFKSSKVYKAGGVMKVDGMLTLHGVAKPVTLTIGELSPEVKDPYGLLRRGAVATAVVNRRDFGLTWSKTLEAGGVVVGDEVKISLEVEFVRKAS